MDLRAALGPSCVYKPIVPRKYVLFVGLALLVVVLDQYTKYLVLRDLTGAFSSSASVSERLSTLFGKAPAERFDGLHYAPKAPVVFSESFFRLRYAENPGAAWGLFRSLPENVRGPLFHLVSIGAVLLISFYFSRLTGDPNERWAYFGLPLVLGGALGNYIDRLARGFVVDFLEAHWYDKAAWPSFNIADSAICIGVGMLVIDSIVRREKKQVLAG